MNYDDRIEKLTKELLVKQSKIDKNNVKLSSGRLTIWEIRFIEHENQKLVSECNLLVKKLSKCEDEIESIVDNEKMFESLPDVLKNFYSEMIRMTDANDTPSINRIKNKVVGMYNKILNLAGSVDDWSTITFEGVNIFGRLIGDKNTVRVDTYVAGGSVQHIHNRIFVRVEN